MAEASVHADSDRVWELMKKITFCMLASWDGQRPHARPMSAYVRRAENAVYFLTDIRRQKDDEIAQYPEVCLAFADTGGQKYVSVSGRGAVTNDRAKIKELWGMEARAWWDSPDDLNIRLLKVAPGEAEYWDSPGTVVSYIKMAAAAVTGSRPDIGKNRKVAM
jgi:general stress protein 26